MQKFYFTFGSWEKYPFQSTYLVVEAESKSAAVAEFRKKHPDIHEGTINCADIYGEKDWVERVKEYYKEEPAEVLRTELAWKLHRISVLMENTMKLLMEHTGLDSEWLLNEIGCTKEELAEIGVEFTL